MANWKEWGAAEWAAYWAGRRNRARELYTSQWRLADIWQLGHEHTQAA